MTGSVRESAVRPCESCVFDQLLGETLRPGGLKLTARMAEVAGIDSHSSVLDIACGKGTTAFFLAREYRCRVTGIDLSEKMISLCRNRSGGISDAASFLLGDGENLPFRDASFDAVVSECSFSLMPDKDRAARDMYRVLRPGGRLVITDIALRGEVDLGLRERAALACCLAGARRAEEYIALFERVGFSNPLLEDHSPELRKIAFRLAAAFGSTGRFAGGSPVEPRRQEGTAGVSVSSESLSEFLRLGKPGYVMLAVSKG